MNINQQVVRLLQAFVHKNSASFLAISWYAKESGKPKVRSQGIMHYTCELLKSIEKHVETMSSLYLHLHADSKVGQTHSRTSVFGAEEALGDNWKHWWDTAGEIASKHYPCIASWQRPPFLRFDNHLKLFLHCSTVHVKTTSMCSKNAMRYTNVFLKKNVEFAVICFLFIVLSL